VTSQPIPLNLLPDSATIAIDGSLSLGGCSVGELAEQYGTPLFIYDEDHIRERCRQAVAAFGVDRVIYASKAFLCSALARLVSEEGLLLDVASGGELFVVLNSGVSASRCVLHGNNKSSDELEMAITAGVRHIVVDSFDEIGRLEVLRERGLPAPQLMIRVTPGVEAHTHEFIATGQDDSKFGFNLANGDAAKAIARIKKNGCGKLIGVHCHIGSSVFGVAYTEGEQAPTITEWGSVLLDACQALGVQAKVSVEPGRAIVASSAITVYRVGTVKEIPGIRTYVSVDGGMSDNPRPVLYGSGYEAFKVSDVAAARPMNARLVGKHCESGDILIFDGYFPADLEVGDLIATPVTGAYGHSMASNYNKVPRPAVVFVSEGTSRLVVRRETYEDLVRFDVG
jgi:diaminopimelate decarboxylase